MNQSNKFSVAAQSHKIHVDGSYDFENKMGKNV